MRKQTIIKSAIVLVALCGIIALIFFMLRTSRQNKCHELLRGSEYNCVFLSMFPTDSFNEEYFKFYRAQEVLIPDVVIPNFKALQGFVRDVALSENEMTTIYLGVDPKKVSAAQVLSLREAFPGVDFEVIPTFRRLSDWRHDLGFEKSYNAYLSFTQGLLNQDHVRVYTFFAQEWLIADDTNFQKGLLLTEPVAERIYIYADGLHNQFFTAENVASIFDDFNELLTSAKKDGYQFPNLSDYDVVMLGDSVFGLFTDHSSIPELVSYLSGARTYNCGWSGSTAGGENPSSGVNVVDAYLSGDLSSIPEEVQTHAGLEKWLQAEAAGPKKNVLFVLHYGLNDYFNDELLANPLDPYDQTTYCGAIRTIIEKLQKARPDAKILLIAPNATLFYDGGTMPMGDNGASLLDYADALIAIGEEYGIPVQDDYHQVIPPEKAARFLVDEVHPNEAGRYQIAKEILRMISVSLQ